MGLENWCDGSHNILIHLRKFHAPLTYGGCRCVSHAVCNWPFLYLTSSLQNLGKKIATVSIVESRAKVHMYIPRMKPKAVIVSEWC